MKMYCIFAKESIIKMNGVRGKMCTQAGHAFLHCAVKSDLLNQYLSTDLCYKITLVVDSIDDLIELEKSYSGVCATHLVTDVGLTVFNGPVVTCLGIGPIPDDQIKDDLRRLKTFT